MKRAIILLLFLGACSRPAPPSEAVQEYNKPFSELQKEKEAYVHEQVKKYGPAVLSDEAGPYGEYMRWLRFWGPRLGPNGTYRSYHKNLKDYYEANREIFDRKVNSASAPGNMDNWYELGPFVKPNSGIPSIGGGGGELGVGIIHSLVIHRQNPSKLLGTSLAGGLFFSSNKGLNWSNAGSDAWFRSGCSAAAFAPDDEATWYAASNVGGSHEPPHPIGSVGGVYRTTNSGLSWDVIANRATFHSNPNDGEATVIRKIIIDPKHSNIGYLGTNVGLYRSTNINTVSPADVSWSPTSGSPAPVLSGAIEDIEFTTDTTAISTVLVSYSNSGAWNIVKSTDQGNTWSSVPAQPSFYAGTTQIVLEVTDAASNLLYVLNRKGLDPTELWICNLPGTWTQKQSLANAVGRGHSFAVSNFNPDVIYAGDGLFLSKSINGGSDFTQVPSSTYHNDVEDIITPHASCASCSQEVYVSTHGGVNYSSDETATMQSRSNGLGLALITSGSGSQGLPERIAIGVDHDGSILSSGSYGSNWHPGWTTVFGGDGGQALIDYSDADKVWVEHQNSAHQFSSTGGAGNYSSTAFDPPNDFFSKIVQNQLYPAVVYSKSQRNITTTIPTSSGTTTVTDLFEDLFRSRESGLGPIERLSDFRTTHSLPKQHFILGMFPSPSDPNVMYVSQDENVAYTSRLFRNTNVMDPQPGAVISSWIEMQFPHPLSYGSAAVDLNNPNIVYFNYGGQSWQFSEFYKADYTNAANPPPLVPVLTNFAGTLGSGGLPNTRMASIILEKGSNGGIYTATDIGVFYTNNKMINTTNPPASLWIRVGTGLPNIPLANMDINYTVNKIRAYTRGRGIWEHDLVCPSDLVLNFTGAQAGTAFYEAVNQITSNATVNSSSSITYRAGTYAELSPGFIVTPDNANYFYAFIHPCNQIGNSP